MGRRSTISSNSSGSATDTSVDGTAWGAGNCLQQSRTTSDVPYKGVSETISATRDKLFNILKLSVRVLWNHGKRQELVEPDEASTELETSGADIVPEAMDQGVSLEGQDKPSKRKSAASMRSNGKPSRNGQDSPPPTPADAKSGPAILADDTSKEQKEPETSTVAEVADFMDLQDPFACYTVGSPQIVKDLTSALPPAYQSTNRVVDARNRSKRTLERTLGTWRRPGSAGRRPGSAGKRPGSAGSNNGKARFEWKVRPSSPTIAMRSVRFRPPTPRRPLTPKYAEPPPPPSSFPPMPITAPCTNSTLLHGPKSIPSGGLSQTPTTQHPATMQKYSMPTPPAARIRSGGPPTQLKRPDKSKATPASLFRSPTGPKGSARVAPSPSLSQHSKPLRRSSIFKHYSPFVLPSQDKSPSPSTTFLASTSLANLDMLDKHASSPR